jgi:hypothetical protein
MRRSRRDAPAKATGVRENATVLREIPYLGLRGRDPIPADMIRECEPLRLPVDPRPYLEANRVGQRRRIFLDQSYWLNLIKRPVPVWREIEEALRAGVTQGWLLVPVTGWNLLELSKLRDKEQGQQCIALMSELSKSVVFRDRDVRIKDELAYAVRNHERPPAMRQVPWWFGFSMYPGMYGDVELVSHPSAQGRQILERLGAELIEEMVLKGLLTVEPRMLGYPEFLKKSEDEYERRMAEFRKQEPGKRLRYREQFRKEQAAIVDRLARDGVDFREVLGDELLARFAARYPTDPDRRAFHIDHVPTLFLSIAVLTAWVESGATYERNDFFDIENLITAIPYAHIAAVDKMMRHVAVERLKLEEQFSIRVVDKPDDLLAGVRALGDAQ